jgi:membrane protein YdbS with pleckstrin-like domain
MHSHGNTVKFRSRIDWWLAALIFGALGLAAWRVGAEVWWKPTPDNWVAAGVTALLLALAIWTFATTAYDVDTETLMVRSGPIHARVPIASIRRISTSSTLLAGPALSLRRLEVEYGKYDTAIVSPHDQAGFIAALVARNPTIEIRP